MVLPSRPQPQNLTEQIVQRYAVNLPAGKLIQAGDYVSIRPAHCMTHDNSWPVAVKFRSIGASVVRDSKQLVIALDHDVQNRSEKNLQKYANIEAFAREQGIDFYPAGRGIGHQIMVEEGYAFPLSLVVASDSHSNMYGGVGCLGTPVVRTDAAAIWATGQTWWQVPSIAKVELTGSLQSGVTGKDVIIALCGLFKNDQVLNHAIEFTGDGVASLSVDDRLTIANMTTEWGALSGLFPVDSVLLSWLRNRADFLQQPHPRISHARIAALETSPVSAHPDASYAIHIKFDLSTLTPSISGPNSVKLSSSLAELDKKNIAIQKAYIVSCTNSRLSDLKAAADVVRGKHVATGVELYVAAASSEVQAQSEQTGDWQTLLDAGAFPLPAGCGPCIGLGIGLLQDGEVGISATNRNFKGRMGSPKAQVYLANPAVVAASALAGRITGPTGDCSEPISATITYLVDKQTAVRGGQEILSGFPTVVKGEIVFCDQDNMTTDGIYPGKYTYQDDITPEKMAEVCMENYDPEFSKIAQFGDIIVGGNNFGTGSSREQAATALLSKEISLVVAGSFGDIFKRNSINNALLCLEVPKLVDRLRQVFSQQIPKPLTIRTGWFLTWDVANSTVHVRERTNTWTEPVGEMGRAVQELYVKGGLEGWVRSKI